MINTKQNRYTESLEMINFLKEFCKKYKMLTSIEKISSEFVLTLVPFSRDTNSNIVADELIKILLKNNIHYLKYYSLFGILHPYYNYFKIEESGLVQIKIETDESLKRIIRLEKLKEIIY
jgi:hypothetical protein